MIPSDPAERHRAVAAAFGAVAAQVPDWSAPTPVPDWCAADVVEHLMSWSCGYFGWPAADGWDAHSAAVQERLDAGDERSAEINQIYTTDVFMHAWDLARSAGLPDLLDPDEAEAILGGMRGIEPMLRESGQFGTDQPVPADAPAGTRLMAFCGRNPNWPA